MLIETLVATLILIGAAFSLIGSIGLASLPDFFCRLHGPTKATTLGVGGMLAASALYFSAQGPTNGAHPTELLVALFLFMTAPVSAHLLAKAALRLRLRSLAPVPVRFRQQRADRLG